MTERRALGLVFFVSLTLAIVALFGLSGIESRGEVAAFAIMLILCGGAWAVAAVTGHYGSSPGDDD